VLTEAGWETTPFERQDSSMLGLLAQAQALAIRPVFAPAAAKGDPCRFIRLR
jgi:molybdopterin molybdotransferase